MWLRLCKSVWCSLFCVCHCRANRTVIVSVLVLLLFWRTTAPLSRMVLLHLSCTASVRPSVLVRCSHLLLLSLWSFYWPFTVNEHTDGGQPKRADGATDGCRGTATCTIYASINGWAHFVKNKYGSPYTQPCMQHTSAYKSPCTSRNSNEWHNWYSASCMNHEVEQVPAMVKTIFIQIRMRNS